MRRAFQIAVVTVATLGLVGVGVATCCPSGDGRCEHPEDAGHPSASETAAAAHCAPASSPSLEARCCMEPATDAPDYGVTSTPPLPGAPAASAFTSLAADSGTGDVSSPRAVAPSPVRRSPILRL